VKEKGAVHVLENRRDQRTETKSIGNYEFARGGVSFINKNSKGEHHQPLSNFCATIQEEITLDDGADTQKRLSISGSHNGFPLEPIGMTVETFKAMAWPEIQWGTRCIVEPGAAARDRLRHAIQQMSHHEGITYRTVYGHTGWRQIGDRWCYLSADASIDASGSISGVDVDLGELKTYGLSQPSRTAAERKEAAAASLRCLHMGPRDTTVPILAAVFLAPFSQALKVAFSLWIEGPSRSYKSSMAGVAVAHYGPKMDYNALPCGWYETGNAIEMKLFTLQDALVVIDDYAPPPSHAERQKIDALVHRVVRNIGNRRARSRLRKDLNLDQERRSRGLVIITAEHFPSGESLNSRMFGITTRAAECNIEILSECQRRGREGVLSRCLADFLRGIASDYEKRMERARAALEEFERRAMRDGLRARLLSQVTSLMVGWIEACSHWHHCGVLSADGRRELMEAGYAILFQHAVLNESRVSMVKPAEIFVATLGQLLSAKMAYLESKDGSQLAHDGRYGARESIHSATHIGWVDEKARLVHLLPQIALAAVNNTLRAGGGCITLSYQALVRQLVDSGFAPPLPREKDDRVKGGKTERVSHVVRINDKAQRVLTMFLDKIMPAFDGEK
jgi:hypothetical protein